MCSELTPAWLLEIGATFEVTFAPIFREQGSTVEESLPPCIVSFVSMPQIHYLKRLIQRPAPTDFAVAAIP